MEKSNTWGFYDQLRPQQIEAILNEKPIAFLPWGAIEYHGNHNPIGLDSIKASNMSVDLAKEVGGIVMPVINLAANLIKSYPNLNFKKHSLEFSEGLIEQICTEYLRQLVEQDFKIIILLSGHAGEPHLEILKKIAAAFNSENPNNYCWALAEFDVLPKDLLIANHSAFGETSLQLHYAPKTVDLESLPKHRPISLELDAVFGDNPRLANAAHGEKIVKSFVKNASKKIFELITIYC
jgi:creatinine amidohydrolase